MFKSQNFCHIASNNRNNVKVGVFVYRTTDTLETVLTSGYFNDRIIDINLHDIIIHEKVDITDQTKVQRNLLCVTQRTLENVGTTVIKSKWEGDIEQAIADLRTYVDNNFVKLNGTSVMTGPLLMRATDDFKCAIAPYWDGIGFFKLNDNNSVTLMASLEYNSGFEPATNNTYNIGANARKWKNLYLSGSAYISKINNGYDISVPVTTSADTLALKSQVDLAANSGRMITDQGVWYAKMYAATVAPSAEDGTNYADFSQVDSENNPIIVIYTRTSGAWVQSETITPPVEYDGYVPITSKIWDIAEQAGQQGGRILWNHQSKEFTPYPQIISFEDIEVTGDSTVIMPATPTDNSIPNKKYVDDAVSGAHYHPELLYHEWDDHLRDDMQWLRADTFSWQDGTVYEQAYQHLVDDIADKTLTSETVAGTTIYFYLADDGHKICPAAQETNVSTIYSATGSAWYYIIDTDNDRFKLPRVNPDLLKFGATSADVVTNGETLKMTAGSQVDKKFVITTWNLSGYKALANLDGGTIPAEYNSAEIKFASESGLYADLTTATGYFAGAKYLYFYVGSFTQEAIENTAGLNAELFNDKADTDLSNTPMATADYVVESQLPTAENNYTWYRKYKSGWVEQGGSIDSASGTYTVTFPITMADTHYTVLKTMSTSSSNNVQYSNVSFFNKTTTSAQTVTASVGFSWQVSGMAAS